MKFMKPAISPIIVGLVLSWWSYAFCVALSPTQQLQTTVDAIIDVLKDENLKKHENKQKRRDKITALVSERFDFTEMSKRSLALHWRDRTPEEKKEFSSLFARLLQATYIGRIEAYSNEKVVYEKEEVKEGYASVYTKIKSAKADIPIIYKLILEGDRWMVYDVDIEGVSLVNTYRSQFSQILAKESFRDLINRLSKKTGEVESGAKPS